MEPQSGLRGIPGFRGTQFKKRWSRVIGINFNLIQFKLGLKKRI